MPRPWTPGEPEDDALDRLLAAEGDAWRGDAHPPLEPWADSAADDTWRGVEHLADWPESSAGPEYWMYKRSLRLDDRS